MPLRDPRERLAREICWVGFASPKAVGATKAAYWEGLPEESRDEYRKRAREFIWLMKSVDLVYVADVLGL